MTQSFRWPEPAWLGEIADEEDKKRAAIRFRLRLAALYCSSGGDLDSLALAAGYRPGSVKVHDGRPLPGHKLATALERTLGRELFPRELFAPDIYL